MRFLLLGLLSLIVLTGAVGCQSARVPQLRDAKAATTDGVTMSAEDLGGGVIAFAIHNTRTEPITYFVSNEMPLEEIVVRNARGKELPYANEGPGRFESGAFYSSAYLVVPQGQAESWNFALRRYFRLRRGSYSVDLHLYVSKGEMTNRNVGIVLRDLKVRIP